MSGRRGCILQGSDEKQWSKGYGARNHALSTFANGHHVPAGRTVWKMSDECVLFPVEKNKKSWNKAHA